MDAQNYGPVGPDAGQAHNIGGFVTNRTLLHGDATGGRFSVVETRIEPKQSANPPHRNSREDMFLVVVEGRVGAQLGDEVFEAGPGELVRMPRGQWHCFWNAGEEPARAQVILSPAGYENSLEQMAQHIPEGAPPDMDAVTAIAQEAGVELDLPGWMDLIQRQGLDQPPGWPASPA